MLPLNVPTFKKYATKPKNWEEAHRLFKTIARMIHPDKGGNTAEFQALVNEFEQCKLNFQQAHACRPLSNIRNLAERIAQCRKWLVINRGPIVQFIRVSINLLDVLCSKHGLQKNFKQKVLLLDTFIAWATEWEIVLHNSKTFPNIPLGEHLEGAKTKLFLMISCGSEDEIESVSDAMHLLYNGMSFPGAVPEVAPCMDTFEDESPGTEEEMDMELEETLRDFENDDASTETQDRLRSEIALRLSTKAQLEELQTEYEQQLEKSNEDKVELVKLQKRVKKEKALRKTAARERDELREQLESAKSQAKNHEPSDNGWPEAQTIQVSIKRKQSELEHKPAEKVTELTGALQELFDFLTDIKTKNGKFELRDAMFQAYIKDERLNGNEMDPLLADRKANNYMTHHALKLKANNISMETFTRRPSYAMNFKELSELFLQLFEWFRNIYSIISENALLPSSETLLALKGHLVKIRCQLTPSVVMCILNVTLDIAKKILPEYIDDSVCSVMKAKCMFSRDGKRCKLTVILDDDFGKASSTVYCRHHSTNIID